MLLNIIKHAIIPHDDNALAGKFSYEPIRRSLSSGVIEDENSNSDTDDDHQRKSDDVEMSSSSSGRSQHSSPTLNPEPVNMCQAIVDFGLNSEDWEENKSLYDFAISTKAKKLE